MDSSKNIVDALELEDLPLAEQENVLSTLGDLLFRESLIRTIELMDEPTKKAFDELLAKDASEEEVMTFLEKNVPGADAAVEEAVAEITGDILSGNLPA